VFKQAVHSTALTSNVANDFFRNITGEYFSGDVSFVSSMRALLHSRMKDDDNIHLSFHRSYCDHDLTEDEKKNIVKVVTKDWFVPDNGNQFCICSVRCTDGEGSSVFDGIDGSFVSSFHDYERIENITSAYRKLFHVSCFVNKKIRTTVLFVENLSLRRYHYLQASILAAVPWYYDNKVCPPNDLELELIKSTSDTESEQKYVSCIEKIAEKFDFRSGRIRSMLKGFENKFYYEEKKRVADQISSNNSSIISYNNEIGSLLKKVAELEVKMIGLEAKTNDTDGDSEIMEYFLANKRLILETVSENNLDFAVKDYITYFDEDMAKRVIKNRSSYVYLPHGRDRSGVISVDDIKLLMTAIFVDQKLRIRTCAAYRLKMNGNVSPFTGHSFDSSCNSYMPNPHIDRFQCMGNYTRTVNELLIKHDYVGAIEQCIASAKSLNFGDSAVMTEFMETVYGVSSRGYTNNCIELPDGSVTDPSGAIQWLKENSKEKEKPDEKSKKTKEKGSAADV